MNLGGNLDVNLGERPTIWLQSFQEITCTGTND